MLFILKQRRYWNIEQQSYLRVIELGFPAVMQLPYISISTPIFSTKKQQHIIFSLLMLSVDVIQTPPFLGLEKSCFITTLQKNVELVDVLYIFKRSRHRPRESCFLIHLCQSEASKDSLHTFQIHMIYYRGQI